MKIRRHGLKLLILLSTLYAMLRMLHWTIGFTFFTQLSNLFAAAVVAGQLAAERRGRPAPGWLTPLKFSATLSVQVTFLVFLTLLAPRIPGGLPAAYRQDHWASLCLHLITPLLMLADFLRNDEPLPRRRASLAWGIAPPLGYFLFILLLGRLGVRWAGGTMAAPYLFLNYDAPAGWFGFRPETVGPTTLGVGVFYVAVALVAAFLLLGVLLLELSRRVHKRPAPR